MRIYINASERRPNEQVLLHTKSLSLTRNYKISAKTKANLKVAKQTENETKLQHGHNKLHHLNQTQEGTN